MSGLFKLNSSDFLKGAVSAVVAALVFTIAGIFSTPDFNLFAADWSSILQTAVNAAVAAAVGYLGKNLMTDKEGAVLGVKATKPKN